MITIVSGLPRSGTSLLMQMLDAGGYPVLCDDQRPPDADNPRGYFEYSPVRRLEKDNHWLPRWKRSFTSLRALGGNAAADKSP